MLFQNKKFLKLCSVTPFLWREAKALEMAPETPHNWALHHISSPLLTVFPLPSSAHWATAVSRKASSIALWVFLSVWNALSSGVPMAHSLTFFSPCSNVTLSVRTALITLFIIAFSTLLPETLSHFIFPYGIYHLLVCFTNFLCVLFIYLHQNTNFMRRGSYLVCSLLNPQHLRIT